MLFGMMDAVPLLAIAYFDDRLNFVPSRSYGMDVNRFNELSESISKQSGLRKRVLLQSYLYKYAVVVRFCFFPNSVH